MLTPRGAERLEYLRGLRYGDVVTGVVVKIADFGVTFVELGGVDAMMNIPEVSWRPLDSPADVLREGEERAFTVLSVEIAEDGDGRDRISLSLKDLHPDPMREFARDGLGRTLRGTVTKEVPFGVFVAVADGVEGLLHHDVLGGLRPAVGDGIEVTVTGVNVVNRQVRLAPARPTGS
ncbi:S1 RNA-binding domain-containing protein [Streptomyces sp. NPDC005805]|uniref:S1 RNA-binding domain-containing protein n=1 Tax=Streptomyces sp. NPDC005805 TaxID=3157068 RepID=UPI003400D00D